MKSSILYMYIYIKKDTPFLVSSGNVPYYDTDHNSKGLLSIYSNPISKNGFELQQNKPEPVAFNRR